MASSPVHDLNFIDTQALPHVPWKNGGGTTREIAQSASPDGFAWRLSMAEVATPGAFSIFPGMSRILTVIDGDGLELHSPDEVFEVPFGVPFGFSGETSVSSVLRNGPIIDFNVIFDPALIDAEVHVLRGPTQINLVFDAATILGVYGVAGPFSGNATAGGAGDFSLVACGSLKLCVADDSRVLLVELRKRGVQDPVLPQVRGDAATS